MKPAMLLEPPPSQAKKTVIEDKGSAAPASPKPPARAHVQPQLQQQQEQRNLETLRRLQARQARQQCVEL